MVEEHRFPCDRCGADMRFAPGEGQLVCDHCGNETKLEEPYTGGAISELDFEAALNARLPDAQMEETRVLSCDNCGAQVEFDADLHAKECPFCATPIVTDTGTHRHIKPGGLLPFKLDEREARAAMTGWLGSLWFAPSGLQEYARKGRELNGIYVPYWTFDADTASRYRGERGEVYYVTKTVERNGKRQQVREARIRWHRASGRVTRFFDDVLILASKTLPKDYTDALEPWDLGALVPYTPDYLAGFRAEGYQIELRQGYDEARQIMDQVIQRDVRFDIGGDRQRIHDIDTSVRDVTFKHVLLPIWLAAYKYRGKSYRFVVNARTGRVKGERPWSAMKITIAVVIGLLIAVAVGFALAQGQ